MFRSEILCWHSLIVGMDMYVINAMDAWASWDVSRNLVRVSGSIEMLVGFIAWAVSCFMISENKS